MSNTRFAVAVHVLSVLRLSDGQTVPSSLLASSVGTNPVVIRKLLVVLAQAGLIVVERGNSGGARLARAADDVNLADVLDAVTGVGDMVKIHGEANPACPVGRNIGHVLDLILNDGFDAFRSILAKHTIEDLVQSIRARDAG
ncbi:Rrf2 family transcriptional regulator [Spongiibacter sp. KMU-166]|uniref:Rrf2 family transcriptional regulator n=1 Tax=Spongiibacter thalassae TaxID=2721624 RepID=A0ABX1GHF5_9GAMM|nr:Rrf2 family transcriptional regulator [Spongiibacter thalassae]NKI18650.1 Rrf2 family transcriptional regulator [Spongiibacter thalassae]